MKNEENILNRCLERFKALAPVKEIKIKKNEINKKNHRIDGILEVHINKEKLLFVYEIKRIIKRPIPEQLYIYQKNINENFMLFAEYVNPSIAEDLKKNNVNFIDSQGNAFIHIPNHLYIDVQGNKLEVPEEKQLTAIFQSKGLHLLTLLLTHEDAINYSLRDLARASGISLGRTGTIMKELRNHGFIIKTSQNKFEFSDKKKLFEKWIENYGERLRPNLLIGTYKISPKTDIQKIAQILKNRTIDFAFGGETGAEILSQYFRAGCIDLFIPEAKMLDVIKHIELAPSKEYNIRLFNLYSDELLFKDKSFSVPLLLPIMMYAELLFQGNDRATETAEMIFDRYIKKMFK